MKRLVICFFSLFLGFTAAVHSKAEVHNFEVHQTSHNTKLAGLTYGEARFIKVDEYINNKFVNGYFFCAPADEIIYGKTYTSTQSNGAMEQQYLLKFSLCDDETLAHCEQFATDKFRAFKNKEGFVEFDITKAAIDASLAKHTFHNCAPNLPPHDDLVKSSIHQNDRRLAHVG